MTGLTSTWFVTGYQHATGTTPPYPAAAAFAAGVIWQRCACDAETTDSLRVLAAAYNLDTTTLFGRFCLDSLTGVQTGHQVRVVRWQHGHRIALERTPIEL